MDQERAAWTGLNLRCVVGLFEHYILSVLRVANGVPIVEETNLNQYK